MTSTCTAATKHNFYCVVKACLELINLPLVDILATYVKDVDLFNRINSCPNLLSGRNKLRSDQRNICYLKPPAVPDYKTFDFTLLYKLIRNLCHSLRPTQGWGNEPKTTDIQVGDDIERLRLFRNNYYAHAVSEAIPDTEFEILWRNLKSVINRIQSKTTCSVNYEQELIKIEHSKFNHKYLEKCELLLEATLKLKTDERDQPEVVIKGKDTVRFGDPAQFEAVLKPDSSCWSITWQKRSGRVIEAIDKSKKKYSGSTNRKLVIQSVCKEDEGEYQVLLSHESNGNVYLKCGHTICLLVGELPHLKDLEVTTGDEGIIIHYEVCGQLPEVQRIEWKKDGQVLDTNADRYVGGSINDSSLTIRLPTEEDKGEYSCEIANAVGSVSKDVMLDVPSVIISTNPTVHFGSKATITAVISSIPSPEHVKWQKSKDGNNFKCIDITKPLYYGSNDIPFKPLLVIPKATFDDKLNYRLLVRNKIGESVSDTVYLNVTGSPPNITTSQATNTKKKLLRLIGNVSLYDDSPDIQDVFWTKNGEKIDSKGSGGRLSDVTTDDNPSLTIREVCPYDAGHYRLTAVNAVGLTSDEIVLGAPDVSFEKIEEKDGSQCFFATIQSIPAPCFVQWSLKGKNDELFTPIDVCAEDYKGTLNTLPHPVLIVKNKDQFEYNSYQIEVANFVGSTIKQINDDQTLHVNKKLAKDEGSDRENPLNIDQIKISEFFKAKETYRFEPIQSEKLKELLNSFKVDFPDELYSESFIHQILQDDMLKKLVTAVKSLSKGIMLTTNINEIRHAIPTVGACVFEVDVIYDGDQFSVIRKNASSNDFFNVNEEYLTRVILINSKSLPVVDAKLLVYKKYKHVINRRKILLQHEYEEFDDVAKCVAFQILSSFCTFVESLINAFTMDLQTIISDYPVESLTVEKIKRLCEEVFERIDDETIGTFESKREWRRWVADEIGRIMGRKREPVCSNAWVEIKNISQKTVKHLNAILIQLEEFQTCVLPVDQNKQVEEWLKRDVILDKSVFKMHPSLIKYITGYKDRDDKKQVVKVYLHGDDKKAENVFKECCKTSTDTYFEFVNVERSKGGNKEVEELKQRERKAPAVDNSTRKQLKQIIQEYGDKIYARHSNVVGIRIGKARRVGDTIQEHPCLVLYCLDKFLVPFGEKPLPEAIAGWPCDIREDFVRFGICPNRCLASKQNLPDPGCSIGIPSDDSSGSVGFLIESKDPLHTFGFGFLTASHVAVKRFEQLYHDEKLLSMHYLKLNDHFIVHPSWIDNGCNDHRIGKVVESFCGNYGLNKIGMDFAVIASSYCRNEELLAGKETLKVAKEGDLIIEKDIVTKTGRTTGTTYGYLMDDSLTVKVDRSFLSRGYFAFFNCYAIEDNTDDKPFFLEGDSGSGVYVMENGKPSKPLGIAFAYLDSQTAVCNISMIVDKLDLQIIRYLENKESLKTFEELKISDEKTEEESQEPMEET